MRSGINSRGYLFRKEVGERCARTESAGGLERRKIDSGERKKGVTRIYSAELS